MLTPSETRAREARERPIIFSASMVRAILAGRKSQTRRIMKRPTDHFHASYTHLHQGGEDFVWSDGRGGCQRAARLPARVGDRLWVREAWTHDAADLDALRSAVEDVYCDLSYGPYYRATEVAPDTMRWRSPIFMPRWASRLTLEVTDVRVERLQDISGDDVVAEGAWPADQRQMGRAHEAVAAYRDLWNSIHGKDAWDANPWVAALTFQPLPASLESQKEGAADSASVKERA